MTDNVDRLGRRMVELNNALQDKKTNPDFGFEGIKSIETIVKFEVFLNDAEDGVEDGIYVYMNDKGELLNAEYFVKEEGDVTIITFTDEQLELVLDLFGDFFNVNVE
ncbi:hypothetical protein [Methanosphaera sp.]